MASAAENPTPATVPPVKPRRRWFRFLYQFSLRTMLIGMTLAAIGCWWFLRPQVQEEELAGRYLKLRRQVRLVGPASDSTTTDDAPLGIVRNDTSITSVGSWQLRDENDDVLVDGRYESDLPQGKWTLWHANGQKAAEGDVFRGGRTGPWRVWDERGTLRSEVTYRAVAPPQPVWRGGPPTQPFVTSPIPVVGMIGPLGQMAPPFQPPPQPSLADLNRYASQRHGPCRAWYASGKLQFEGQYADDRRDGLWTYYDEQGRVDEKGSYQADLREGEWTTPIAGTKPGPGVPAATSTGDAPGASLLPANGSSKVAYIAGRTQAEHDALLARLQADLASGSARRQAAAATRLAELGPAGVPILTGLLGDKDANVKLLALRTLTQQEALTAELLPRIEPLVDHADERLALRAMVAVYALAPHRQDELYPRIMALVEERSSSGIQIEALWQICNADPQRRQAAFLKLVEILAGQHAQPGMSNPYLPPDWSLIQQRLKVEPVPLLAQSFVHSDRDVRIYVLLVLEEIVESGSGQRPMVNGPGAEITWPIPPAVQAVIDKARTDPDPDVRTQAEQIGREMPGGGMGGGMF